VGRANRGVVQGLLIIFLGLAAPLCPNYSSSSMTFFSNHPSERKLQVGRDTLYRTIQLYKNVDALARITASLAYEILWI
jgi:hypothetical protein